MSATPPTSSAHTHCHGGIGHSHAPIGVSSQKMAAAVGLTVGFVIAEAAAAYFAHSLALLSDAGHNLADAAALALSWYAIWIARKPSNAAMTYGYHRVGILAALANATSLVVIALAILWEAVGRLQHPAPTDGRLMIALATAAILLNGTIGLWLQAGAKQNINVRAAYLHMLGDAISAAGVVLAGIIVLATHSRLADPIVSVVIAALILFSSWGILRESVAILLEATPAGLDMSAVVDVIQRVDGVLAAHDLHVWTVGPGTIACSVHILVGEQTIREGQQILKAVVGRLERDFQIAHTTVQVEVEGHESNDMYCCLDRSRAAHQH